MRTFYFDTETYPLRPGNAAPKMVCLQYAYDSDEPRVVLAQDAFPILKEALESEDVLLCAHNGGFDAAVTSRAFPELLPAWFKALGQYRGRDTWVREKGIDTRRGTLQLTKPKGYFSLAGCLRRRLGVEVAKGEDTWRLRYALLDGVPVDQWPPEALEYALNDIHYLRRLDLDQLQEGLAQPDEAFQVAAAFALQLASVWGFVVNTDRVNELKAELQTEAATYAQTLTEEGLLVDGVEKKAVVQAKVVELYEKLNKQPPRTKPSKTYPRGQIQADAETIDALYEALKEDAGAIAVLAKNKTVNKLLSTYVQPMVDSFDTTMNCGYNVLVATGRTSSNGSKFKVWNPWWPEGVKSSVEETMGTNVQNWPRRPGIRDCIRAREGHHLISCDYNSLELRTLAQACLWLVGRSTFAKGYNEISDWDPHSYMAGVILGIDYEEALVRKKLDPTFKPYRNIGKEINFSLAGGVGAKTFANTANIEEEVARGYIQKYKEAYPEMVEYFALADYHAKTGTPIRQSVSGRVRGDVTYTSGSNTMFQGLASDLAKYAVWLISRACYCEPDSVLFGSRLLAFIHDEVIVESPEDKSHECALEVERLMCQAGKYFCPDVPIAAEAALMVHWVKKAEPIYEGGRLVPYDLGR